MKTTVSAMEARRNFGHLLNTVALTHASITIERVGKPIAQLVGIGSSRAVSRSPGRRDIRSCRGMGKELWQSVEAEHYISGERAAWA
jgi:prevent-host-death family protein